MVAGTSLRLLTIFLTFSSSSASLSGLGGGIGFGMGALLSGGGVSSETVCADGLDLESGFIVSMNDSYGIRKPLDHDSHGAK